MPIFEFQCTDCCTTFERLIMSAQSNAAQDCPQCNGSNTSKQFSTFSTNRSPGSADAMVSSAPPAFS
ncbi:MAG: zinc ribbon domain-containing protein [Candidatus Tectomicrobia bacterium]|nr:zinc ribbon domain-containing protein [Candidatus Tectomicrobia bacterium]